MENNKKIVISTDGPYLVSGNVPLEELIITPKEKGYLYEKGRQFPIQSEYALCRCGKSKNMPFCDGSHHHEHFNGTLTASKEPYSKQSEQIMGPNLILEDAEKLCAFARFCHSNEGSVWELISKTNSKDTEELLIKMVHECPSGRLVIKDKQSNQVIEPAFEQSIAILQDPSYHCSGPLWVRGGIPITTSDGYTYEIRNRVTLCRCGASKNKPFCDGRHVRIGFIDKK